MWYNSIDQKTNHIKKGCCQYEYNIYNGKTQENLWICIKIRQNEGTRTICSKQTKHCQMVKTISCCLVNYCPLIKFLTFLRKPFGNAFARYIFYIHLHFLARNRCTVILLIGSSAFFLLHLVYQVFSAENIIHCFSAPCTVVFSFKLSV